MKKKCLSFVLFATLLIGSSIAANAKAITTNVTGGYFTIAVEDTYGSGYMSVSNNNSKTLTTTLKCISGGTIVTYPSASDSGTKQILSTRTNRSSSSHTPLSTTYTVYTGMQGYSGTVSK